MNLSFFEKENLFEATKLFFNELNIAVKTYTREAQSIESILGKNFEIVKSVYVGYIDENSFENLDQILASSKYKGILVFSLELNKENPRRKEIADLTRAFNRKSKGMPVCLLLKYGTKISLALSERVEYKQGWREGEKIGKVIILRDIDTEKPHAGHLRILEDLKRHNVKNFSELYERWLEIFNVNVLNKKFYDDLSKWYFWAIKEVDFPNDMEKDEEIRNSTNLIRLVTRIIFIWFIKEKKLVPENLFDEKELENILRDFKKKGNYYNAILQNLFFGTLNQKIRERKFAEDGDLETNKNEYGVKNLYRYANMFKSKDEKEICKLFGNIPFLNGGLFDCLDKEDEEGKVKYIDGFSRNKNKQAKIPDILFFNSEPKCQGLIKILNSYKFTVTENTPQEEDVALDPELLGKVFENLLASYNPETKETARKQSGSFYTPREIVNYMVNESLAAYLREKVGEDWENNRQTISALNEIKILDPACGSGAFPMGILHRMVELLQKLDPKNELWKQRQLELAEKIEDLQSREAAIENIERAFAENELDYGRKLFLIENCIYGVDIQPIAIQISKLRFFLSLVIEQKIDEGKDNYGIRPLPNLETKFVAANTLVGLEKENSLFRTPEINDKENELKQVRHEYFTANNRKKKLDLQKKDRRLRKELSKMLKAINFAEKSADNIANFDPYDQNVSSKWFDAEWMFGLEQEKDGLNGTAGGFDVVIGNPPYVNVENLKTDIKDYLFENYDTCKGRTDIYIAFLEKSLDLIKENRICSFIIPYAFTNQNYGFLMRKLLVDKYFVKEILDTSEYYVFENAVVKNIILSVIKTKNQKNTTIKTAKSDKDFQQNNFKVFTLNQSTFLGLKDCRFETKNISNSLLLKNKILENTIRLDDICLIAYGARLNHKTEKIGKENYIFSEFKEGYKPFTEGKNIDRFVFTQYGWLNYQPKEHYNSMFPELFENEKIMFINVVKDRLRFAFDDKNFYNSHTVINCVKWNLLKNINHSTVKRNVTKTKIETGKNFDYKFLLGILNSILINWYFVNFLSESLHFYPDDAKELPIPMVEKTKQEPIISLVNQILSAKKKNPAADTAEMEREIDRLVYGLYGLEAEDIKVIETNF
ncbi:hypothetical protein R83H12_02013 [Fibrobacteria bacterium R8-3-H12]